MSKPTGKGGVRPTTRAEREARRGGKKGREAFVPTDAQRQFVEMATAIGLTQEDTRMHILKKDGAPIAAGTLQKHFKRELESGSSKANFKVAGRLFSKAMEGDTACMIFWLKTRAGWRESQELRVGDPNGEPLAAPPTLGDFYAAVALAKPEGEGE